MTPSLGIRSVALDQIVARDTTLLTNRDHSATVRAEGDVAQAGCAVLRRQNVVAK